MESRIDNLIARLKHFWTIYDSMRIAFREETGERVPPGTDASFTQIMTPESQKEKRNKPLILHTTEEVKKEITKDWEPPRGYDREKMKKVVGRHLAKQIQDDMIEWAHAAGLEVVINESPRKKDEETRYRDEVGDES